MQRVWARLLFQTWPVTKAVIWYTKSGQSRSLLEESNTPFQETVLIVTSVVLVLFAGLMSGLTLGLMSLDAVELEVLKRSGSPTERKHAAAIIPVVHNQHFLLVTLLLCNAGAMEALPIFLDRLANPVAAVLISVTAVLFFGEIIPQAICSKYGLAIGAYCSWFVRALMMLCSPLAWPLGKLLDLMLGQEHTAMFRRTQLKALVDMHGRHTGLGGNLTLDEVKVISGALDLTHKTAQRAMTPLGKVFMLSTRDVIDLDTMRRVVASGHSRVPVYRNDNRHDLVGLIMVKELIQYNPRDAAPVADLRMRSLPRLDASTPMYDVFKLFRMGGSHMAVLTVPRAQPPAPLTCQVTGDSLESNYSASPDTAADGLLWTSVGLAPGARRGEPQGEPVGIITIEDVMEELMQVEIVDETDRFVDNEQRIAVNAAVLAAALPPKLRQAIAHASSLGGPNARRSGPPLRSSSSNGRLQKARSLPSALPSLATHNSAPGNAS